MSELRVRPAIQNDHSDVNGLVWAIMAAGIVLMLALLPRMSQTASDAAELRASDAASENIALCEGWGLPKGSPRHSACLRDLVDLRLRVTQDTIADVEGVF